MASRRLAVVVCLALLGLAGPAWANPVVLTDVPSYFYYDGCGPTAAGMIVGYYDAHGFPNLITAGNGTNNWSTNQQAIKDMIASPAHIADYVGYGAGQDRLTPPPFHANNSVADFMGADMGPILVDGDSYYGDQGAGLTGYFAYTGYTNTTVVTKDYYDSTFWTAYKASIDAGNPVELYVDSNGDGVPDHFVVGFGYDAATTQFIFYDPDYLGVEMTSTLDYTHLGTVYGVWGGTFFTPSTQLPADSAVPEPVTMMGLLLTLGGVAGYLRRRSRGSR